MVNVENTQSRVSIVEVGHIFLQDISIATDAAVIATQRVLLGF